MTAHIDRASMPAHIPGETYSYPALDVPAELTAEQVTAWASADLTVPPPIRYFTNAAPLEAPEIAKHALVQDSLDEDGFVDWFKFSKIIDDHRYGRSEVSDDIAGVVEQADIIATGMGHRSANWGEFVEAAAMVMLAECSVEPVTV